MPGMAGQLVGKVCSAHCRKGGAVSMSQ